MRTSERDRKILWGRAANRCAFCRCELVMEGTSVDRESIVGDECHIIPREPGGPRGGESWPESLDSYSNLILLCKVHHKLVDDQPGRFTSENLRRLKRAHEDWVRLTLGVLTNSSENPQPILTWRLQTGREVTQLLSGVQGYILDNDELTDEHDVDLVGSFLQAVHDWGEIWAELEPADHVRAQFQIAKQLRELESEGWLVFGTTRMSPISVGGETLKLLTAVIRVVRADSPHIFDLSAYGEGGNEPDG